jgi:hypothetical protein
LALNAHGVFAMALDGSEGHGVANSLLQRFFEFDVMHRLVFVVSCLDGSEDVLLVLLGCQHGPSTRSLLPLQRARRALPTVKPVADDHRATLNIEATSESAEGLATGPTTVLPKDAILEGGSIFRHDVGERHSGEVRGRKHEEDAISEKNPNFVGARRLSNEGKRKR